MPLTQVQGGMILPSTTLTTPIVATTMGVGGATPAASGSGITFPAAQSASTNANTLDDYEEGTWTPSFIGSVSNPTITYGNRFGYYVKVGSMVYCSFRINIATTAGGSGGLYVSGMPFTGATGPDQFSALTVGYQTAFLTAAPTYGRWFLPGSAVYELYYYSNPTTEAPIGVSHLQNGTEFIGTFVFQSAS
jgi:hypothetical protein